MATIKEIAELAKVSSSTVSRVLNNDKNLSVADVTRKRILAIAEELGYKTVQTRRNSQRRNSKFDIIIGILLCQTLEEEMNDEYFYSIRLGIEKECSKRKNISTKLYRISDLDRDLHDLTNLDGLIIAGSIHIDVLDEIKSQVKNITYINHYTDEEKYDSVTIDFEKSMKYAINHLLELGHRNIGFIGGAETERHKDGQNIIVEERRLTAYKSILTKEGIYDPNLVFIGEFTMSSGYALMHKATEKGKLPDAFFISSDRMAIGALKALNEAGIKVPKDVSIVSFDDIELAKFTSPPLTTVHIPTMEMGRMGVKLIFDRMKDRTLPVKVVVPTKLIVRDSCTQS